MSQVFFSAKVETLNWDTTAVSLVFSALVQSNDAQVCVCLKSIVAKKWEPGNLVPSRFSGEIRKVEARLGKLAKIRKVETD